MSEDDERVWWCVTKNLWREHKEIQEKAKESDEGQVMEKGCENCRYKDRSEHEMPCVRCIRNARDNWEPEQDLVEVVRCKQCKYLHEEEGWCDKHSHFIGDYGEACHPWESANWKMFNADDYCSDGERRSDETD